MTFIGRARVVSPTRHPFAGLIFHWHLLRATIAARRRLPPDIRAILKTDLPAPSDPNPNRPHSEGKTR